ncbi:uricase-like [Halichondria panicea]|uniref:uricase-like n=1 Tax=Halichondria panicea TaxID=6063 RepID=UPI00312BA552
MAKPIVSHSGYGIGKNDVRFMRVRRDGDRYYVTELWVSTELQLSTVGDYERGDNSGIVATDSQKNTVLVLAKQNEITSPEQFAMLICSHFLGTCKQLIRCKVSIEQAPWQRIKQGGAEHSHAFISQPSAIRFCTVSQLRGGALKVSGGMKDVKVLKTTQSGFEGTIDHVLPETSNRTFCTNLSLKYDFREDVHGVDFNGTWETVKSSLLDVFAGYSHSVQNMMYDTAKVVFARVPKINDVEIRMPNIHYYVADLLKLPNSGELLNNPQGMISATFSRPLQAKL